MNEITKLINKYCETRFAHFQKEINKTNIPIKKLYATAIQSELIRLGSILSRKNWKSIIIEDIKNENSLK